MPNQKSTSRQAMSKLDLNRIHQIFIVIKRPNSTIVLPTSEVYRPCGLLLKKRACLMIVAELIAMIILTAVACQVYCHLKKLFKQQQKLPTPTAHGLTWKELLPYGTCNYCKDKLQTVKSKKIHQPYFFDWKIPPVLGKRIHLTNRMLWSIQSTGSIKLHLDPTSHPCWMSLHHERQRVPQFLQERLKSNPISDSQFPMLLQFLLSLPVLGKGDTWDKYEARTENQKK